MTINLSSCLIAIPIIQGSCPTPPGADEVVLCHSDGLPDDSTCKKPKAIMKYTNSTAGVMIATRPCGYVVGVREMFSAESCTQWLLFLLEMTQNMRAVTAITYDRACELHPFVLGVYSAVVHSGRCSKDELDSLKYLATGAKYRIDSFHAKTHKPGKCQPPIHADGSVNRHSAYHPDSPGVEFARGINDSMGESVNRYYSLFNHAVANMGRERFNVFIIVITHVRNNRIT